MLLTAKEIAIKINRPVDSVRYVLDKLIEAGEIIRQKKGNTCLYNDKKTVKKVRAFIQAGRFK